MHDLRGNKLFVLLYVHQKRENFSPSLFSTSLQSSTPLSLILLPIPIVLVLHLPLTSRPSQIAGKGEELWIQKTETLTTIGKKERKQESEMHLIHFPHVFYTLPLLLKQLLEDTVQLQVRCWCYIVVQLKKNK